MRARPGQGGAIVTRHFVERRGESLCRLDGVKTQGRSQRCAIWRWAGMSEATMGMPART